MGTGEVLVVKDSQRHDGSCKEHQLFNKVSKATEDEGHED